jgi:peptidoglycan/xylan/chitin deacetylase (PgdA/CDA1 family)
MEYIQEYSQLKKFKPLGFRGLLRSLALDGLSNIDELTNGQAYLRKPRLQFLYIHHVFIDEELALEKLLQSLSTHHTFLSYSEAINKLHTGTIDKPYIVISSDDGLKNNLRAAKILNDFGVSACFFINPSVIGLTDFIAVRNYCRQKLHFPPVAFLTWDEVDKIQKMGHDIGSHTLTHINIGNSPTDEVIEEINQSYSQLVARCGESKHFAFPYGRFADFNETAKEIVFEAGFSSCATAERGCHINHPTTLPIDKFCILRDHIVLGWSIEHIMHFLIANSKKQNVNNNLFPY